jgi:SAM-dependent methyltransferase
VEDFLPEDAFSRDDEADDTVFYAKDRFVSHLDSVALATVEKIIGELIVEEKPVILDLMASWDSHIPDTLSSSKVVGLGLNENELSRNEALSEYVIHDLNKTPRLPFPDETFDAVINTVSVDYMTRPIEVFQEVGRILKPGGLHLVIFSNRMFPPKAVKIWREAGEQERVILVDYFFKSSEVFEDTTFFVSKGKPRPEDDKYAHMGIPSDPVYAVYADKKGDAPQRKARPVLKMDFAQMPDKETVEQRRKEVKNTLRCPYCEERMKKWAVPQSPFTEWDNEFMYICFNDECPYLINGWDVMSTQGNSGISYRQMYNPDKNSFFPVPVPSLDALKDSIVE